MKVAVFGAGYVGLVQAAVLAEHGHHVVCVDVDPQRIEKLKQGDIPIFEPGLDVLVSGGLKSGALSFTSDAEKAIDQSEVLFIAVGTPPGEDGSADLRYVLAVAETIGLHTNSYKVVVTKSTVPVGTSEKVLAAIHKSMLHRDIPETMHSAMVDVVSNPEFLKEGAAVSDCQRPDRIILGLQSARAEAKMRELYAPMNRHHDKIIVMSPASAELSKYAANAMLATKISFMNLMSTIAESCGADIEEVRHGIGSDPRIGYHFIYAGIGYGGSCFPKDVAALQRTCLEHQVNAGMLFEISAVNERQKMRLNKHINKHFGTDLRGKRFAVWGLSFKPNTDDMREAPSTHVIKNLLLQGAEVTVYDPESMMEAKKTWQDVAGQDPFLQTAFSKIRYANGPSEALQNANALVICTEWKCFRAPDFSALSEHLSDKVIFDGRNLYDPVTVEAAGLRYYGIGRGRSIN